jgi:NAD(P) transhydrogenase subunit alpha
MDFVSLIDGTPGERRVALTPTGVARLVELGARVRLEAGYGATADLDDEAYERAGATFAARDELLAGADVLLALNPPDLADVEALPEGVVVASFLDPFRNPELVRRLRDRKLAAMCLELIPRTSYAQKMDALSSQASLGGYAAVITAADRSGKAFPMMSTPAGTIPPARVFVVGVGVAGLQAIATAKRLGARVEAYDTRPVVAEQVRSLGAKFVELDVGETGETEQGYAKELTDEQLAEQRRQMAKVVAGADVVITTAQLFGRPAPRIIDADMVAGMRPGSVVVDMAAGTGGNVEGSVPDEQVLVHGVTIVGLTNLPALVARDASEMYASNLVALMQHAWDEEAGRLRLDPEGDEVLAGCLLTHEGTVRDERVAATLTEGGAE